MSELPPFPVIQAQDAVDAVLLRVEGLPTPLELEQRPQRLVVARMDGGGGVDGSAIALCPPAREPTHRGWPRTLRRVSYLTKKVIVRSEIKISRIKRTFRDDELGSFSESPAQFVLQLTVTPTVPKSRLDVDLGKVALQNSQRAVNV